MPLYAYHAVTIPVHWGTVTHLLNAAYSMLHISIHDPDLSHYLAFPVSFAFDNDVINKQSVSIMVLRCS